MSTRALARALVEIFGEDGALGHRPELLEEIRVQVRLEYGLAHKWRGPRVGWGCGNQGEARSCSLSELLALRHCRDCLDERWGGGVVLEASWLSTQHEQRAVRELPQLVKACAGVSGLDASPTPGRVASLKGELERWSEWCTRIGGGVGKAASFSPELLACIEDLGGLVRRSQQQLRTQLREETGCAQALAQIQASLLPAGLDAKQFSFDESPVLVGITPPLRDWDGTQAIRQVVAAHSVRADDAVVVARLPRYVAEHLQRALSLATPRKHGTFLATAPAPADEVLAHTAAQLWDPASTELASMRAAVQMAEDALCTT